MPHTESPTRLRRFPRFVREDDGAVIVEYALIIAVISIALVLALQPVFVSGQIGTFISRLTDCLSGAGCA